MNMNNTKNILIGFILGGLFIGSLSIYKYRKHHLYVKADITYSLLSVLNKTIEYEVTLLNLPDSLIGDKEQIICDYNGHITQRSRVDSAMSDNLQEYLFKP